MRQTIPQTPADFDRTRVIERPNGFFWQDKQNGAEYGPFATLLEAVQDMQSDEEAGYEAGETLEEAESEIGISDWLDPDTGSPIEEQRARIEDDH